jgi:heme a synthase
MYIENKLTIKYVSYWLVFMFFIVSVMIIVGGLTRLTDSGLSMTEWQLFTGIIPPLNDTDWNKYFDLYKEIPEYKLQNYLMTLEEFKVIFWWEFIHRFLGRLIGICYLVPLLFFTIKLGIKKIINLYFIFFLICLQGFIGWYMVSSGLINRVDVSHYRLALHLILAFFILSLILWNFLNYTNVKTSTSKLNYNLPLFFLLLIFAQIIIGAFVSGMDGGKIYNSWPLMGSTYFPDDNSINNLFSLTAFNDPGLMQFIHRNLAYLIFFLYLLILIIVYKNNLSSFYKIIKTVGLFLLLQITLGILTLLSGAQIFYSSMHQISSILLVSSCIFLLYLNFKSSLQPSN